MGPRNESGHEWIANSKLKSKLGELTWSGGGDGDEDDGVCAEAGATVAEIGTRGRRAVRGAGTVSVALTPRQFTAHTPRSAPPANAEDESLSAATPLLGRCKSPPANGLIAHFHSHLYKFSHPRASPPNHISTRTYSLPGLCFVYHLLLLLRQSFTLYKDFRNMYCAVAH